MRWRQSARFTPPAAMRISTSPGFGSGTGRVVGISTSGPPGLLISITVWVAGMLASTYPILLRLVVVAYGASAALAPERDQWYGARPLGGSRGRDRADGGPVAGCHGLPGR